MSEENGREVTVYRRGAIGMAIAALVWTAVILIKGSPDEGAVTWLIPIGSAALSVIFYYLHTKQNNPK
ncbi:MAG: hypothetical protein L0220_21340 [Acidobacteria bacterium]|nr:hypothetical protein [Acidobacteriota bacterium]